MITIVDYGMGNLGSIQNMLKRIGARTILSSDPEIIAKAEKILLPGVGAFDAAVQRIQDTGLLEILNHKALVEKIPVLGICLGMQLLTQNSEEGKLPGLGWVPAKTLAFKGRIDPALKIPHMGWNVVKQENPSPLLTGFDLYDEPRFYFVHSYYVECVDPKHVILSTQYGFSFHSAIQKDNIWGAQFHPEKSHRFGMKLFENFAKV